MFGVFSSVLSADSKMYGNARWSALLLLQLKYSNKRGYGQGNMFDLLSGPSKYLKTTLNVWRLLFSSFPSANLKWHKEHYMFCSSASAAQMLGSKGKCGLSSGASEVQNPMPCCSCLASSALLYFSASNILPRDRSCSTFLSRPPKCLKFLAFFCVWLSEVF